MNRFMIPLLAVFALTFSLPASAQTLRYDFGAGPAADGWTAVSAQTLYSEASGYGLEPGSAPTEVLRKKGTKLTRDYLTAADPFRFSVRLPEGNYLVTLTLGDTHGTSATTVKAETRRLMLEEFRTANGETKTVSFNVNIRTPQLSPGNEIKLNSREIDPATGQVRTLTWDDKLTLAFYGGAPAVCGVEIKPAADDVVTVFIIGDSTVTDQPSGGTWGQYLPRWFDGRVVVANHAESGMTIKGFRFMRRWDKIMESARPGDYLLIQLGTNDEKRSGHDAMWPQEDLAGDWVRTHADPEKDYVWGLATMALEAKRHGMIPVIVSPMTKIDRGSATATELMTPYGVNARRGAELGECAYIDLWDMSRDIVAALGKDALAAYADGTHTENYGAYLFSLCIAKGLRESGLPLREYLLPETPDFDPKAPKPSLQDFTCPIEPRRRPQGPPRAQDTSLTRYPEYAYAGEWDTRHPDRQVLRIIKDGKVDFEFVLPLRDEWNRVLEFDDVRILPDGTILYAAMSQLGLLDRRSGKELWKYVCPQGTESHSCQPLAPDLVYFALNGTPGKIVIWNTKLDKLVKEIIVPTENTRTHGQFRHVRRTQEGNFVLALMQEQEVLEISPEGEVLKRIPGHFAWHVDKLPNGNYLLGGDSKHYVREIDGDGKTVWEVTQADLPFPIWNLQTATRLQNGNTLICNWVAGQPQETWSGSVQFFEITPGKQIVWRVSSWKDPDLGPATYLDITSEPDAARGVDVLRPRHADGTPRLNNDTPNHPMGVGKGLHPGRVAWIHAPGVATWDGQTGMWWEERWNDQDKAREMIAEGLLSLTGEKSPKKAWKALFRSFNESHGKGASTYRKGEKIAIKLNMNNTFAYADNEELNSSPYVTLALLESLVRQAGVRQEDITVCEPSRYLTDALYKRCKAAFPKVRFVDNVGGEGREKCEFVENAIPFTSGYGEKQYGLAKCIVEADYVINSALLKIHTGPGVTLTAKNWYGATSLDKDWHQNSHNGVNPDKRWGHAKYSSQVDFIGHKDLGGKTLLYLIDGTYGSRDCNGAPAPKWNMAPFGGDWACSILFSQDPLAIDSVGLDLLAAEWPEVNSLPYCDLYLVEAASLPDTISGVVYDPEQDGNPLSEPLGLHEHWNDAHEYSAIDLVYERL